MNFWYTLINEEIAVCEWMKIKEFLQGNQQHKEKENKSFVNTPKDLMNTSITSIDSLGKASDRGSDLSEIHEN